MMICMKRYQIDSVFNSLPIEIFWYPAKQQNVKTVVLLKGLYRKHDPDKIDGWENQVIEKNKEMYNFVCINTARKEIQENEKIEVAFRGKDFLEECDDIKKGLDFLKKLDIGAVKDNLVVVGSSFGGTVLLGMSDLLEQVSAVIMIGSGCGKSKNTTKPLLRSMPDEKQLLETLSNFRGVFVYVRGLKDEAVPTDSQSKVMNAAIKAKVRLVCEIMNADHQLRLEEGDKKPAEIISNLIQLAGSYR